MHHVRIIILRKTAAFFQMDNTNGLKFLYLNIRSLYKHSDELFLNFGQFEIICLGETWLKPKSPDNCVSHADYTLFRLDRPGKKRGGGLVTYLKSNIGKYAHVVPEYSIMNDNIEQLWIEIEMPNHKKMVLVNTYRPPSGNPTMAVEYVRNCLKSFDNLNKREIVIMGDFNINYLKPNLMGCKQIKELCRDFNLVQLINAPTRITSTTRTLVDMIITNMNFIKESGVYDYVISDHLPIYVIRKKVRTHKEYTCTEGRNMKNYNSEDFCNLIDKDPRWIQFWKVRKVTDMWEIMYRIILDSLNTLLPKRRIRIRTNDPAWFTKEVIDSIALKNKNFRIAKSNPEDASAWTVFLESKRQAKTILRKSKAKYISTTLENNRIDPKQFWKEINTLLGAGKGVGKNIQTIKNQQDQILCDLDAAEYLNDYYVNIGEVLALKFGNQAWTADPSFPRQNKASFNFRIVTEKECTSLIKQIDVNKSSAIDDIKSIFIKDAFLSLNFEVAYLLNESLRLSEFPESWGYSYVTPIPKDGDQLDPSNWRPISQMPIIGRLIEKAIHSQMRYFIDSTGLLHRNQHGFRTGKSTGSAIFEYVKSLYNGIDNKHISISTYIDYKKAFDTVSHDILLKKLHLYGFSKNTVEWFRDYLSKRAQSTLVNGYKSGFKTVNYGVPQGSTLGPTLFIIYVNDLFYHPGIDDSKILMYADDTVVFTSGSDPHDIISESQEQFDNIITWCELNKLTINENKTKTTIFNNNTTDLIDTVTYKGKPLENVKTYKYLGVDICDDLNMDLYVKNVYKKVNYKVYMFSKIRKYITTYAANMIYKQTILPYLDYASFLMDSAHQYSLSLLDKIHNRCMRIIEYKKNSSREKNIQNLMNTYRIQNIRLRRKVQLLSFMFTESKIFKNLKINRPDMVLRNSNKIKFEEKFTRKTTVLNSPLYRGYELWNRLPEDMQKVKTISKFKTSMKRLYYI